MNSKVIIDMLIHLKGKLSSVIKKCKYLCVSSIYYLKNKGTIFYDTLQFSRKLLLELIIFSFLLVVIISSFLKIWVDKTIIFVEPFNVPKRLSAMGYNGEVIANQLIDQIYRIRQYSRLDLREFLGEDAGAGGKPIIQFNVYDYKTNLKEPSNLTFQVPSTGISLEMGLRELTTFLGVKHHTVQGEIIVHESTTNNQSVVELTIRPPNSPSKVSVCQTNKLDSCFLEAAEYISLCTNPLVLALYYYENDKDDDKTRSFDTLKHMLKNETQEDDISAINLWATICFKLGRYEEAIQKYEQIIYLDSNTELYATDAIAHVKMKQNKIDDVLRIYDDLSSKFTDSIVFNNWAYVLNKKGLHAEAIKKCQMAIKIDKSDASAFLNYGIALIGIGEIDHAIEKFKKAAELNPNFEIIYFNWAKALTSTGKLDEANNKFQRVVSLNPKFEWGYLGLGDVYLLKKDYKIAISYYKQAKKLNNKNIYAYLKLGYALEEIDKLDEAISLYQEAAKLDGNDEEFFVHKGVVLKKLGDYDGSINMFKKSIAINPNFYAAYANLCIVFIEQEKCEEAKKIYEQAVENYKPLTNEFKMEIAICFYNFGTKLLET